MSYPYLVDLAWDVVKSVLRDWQSQPYLWSQEIDVQVEIASRLSNVLRALRYDSYLANHQVGAIPGFEQRWSRVTCEPRVQYKEGGNTRDFKPDIVICDDIPDPNHPPGDDSFPILWACELKYRVENESSEQDRKKLSMLVEQGRLKFGCLVHMQRVRADKGDGLTWTGSTKERVWLCEARLPPKKP